MVLAYGWLVVAAQSAVTDPKPRPVADSAAIAVRAQWSPPKIDGRLDDSAWSAAIPIGHFTQRDPLEGAPASMPTEARVLFTDAAIYIGIRAHDPEPTLIMAPFARRDERPPGDWIGVMIDSHYDRRTAFEFAVNPAGVRRDVYRFNDFEEDVSWDGVWTVAIHRDQDGWSAEFRIPLSQLRFVARDQQRFGFNVYREIGRSHEVQHWRLMSKHQRGVVSEFGELAGLDGLRHTRRLEMSPFVAGRAQSGAAQSAGTVTSGADLRLPLASGVSLAASINPDFGQVEADPAVVNLSGTEVFFPEKRPLFVEGADYFRFPLSADSLDSDALLYTRRIGDTGSILGAAKVLGRTSSDWSLGTLSAVTNDQAFFAGRLSRDLHQGRTLLGGFGTFVRRDQESARTGLHSGAWTLALTGSHRFGDGSYLARALAGVSRVTGDTGAMALTQLSSVHFFQRPDQDYARFDPSRTSLTGLGAWAELARDRGPWTWSVKLATRSPNFEVNDAGFLAEAGRHLGRGHVSRRWLTAGGTFRRAELGMEGFWNADFGGVTIARGAGLKSSAQLLNYMTLAAEAWRSFGGADPIALRGGPALMRLGNYFFRVEGATDPNKPIRGRLGLVVRPRDEGVSNEIRLPATLGVRTSSRFDLELSPAYEWHWHREQYVGTGRTDSGERYVLGFLHQRTFRMGLRAGFTFTPSLTLQAYAEPFASSGRYSGYSQVTDPRARRSSLRVSNIPEAQIERGSEQVAFDLDGDGTADLTVPRPDFTVLSFRSTMVLRWEYRNASTASLVIQHDRNESSLIGNEDPFEVIGRLGSAIPATRVLLKVSYWLSM